MRISTNSIFESGVSQLGTLQSNLAKTQMQLSTNRRMLTAADDPIASARALEVTQSQSINTQFATNRQNARSSMSQVELALAGTTSLIQDMQTIATEAGNGALSQADRESLATELEGRLDDLLGVANTADGAGGYLFSGFKSTIQPFSQTSTGAQYHGDQGQRVLQVGSSRQVAVSDSGSSVFENNPTGNGTFVTRAVGANTGSGIVSGGSVTDAALLTGHNYEVRFAIAGTPPATTYTVNDTTTGLDVTAALPFESGKQIAFDGMTFDVEGAPADGDIITVEPSQKQSLFATVTNLITALRGPAQGAAGMARLTNDLNEAHTNLGAALDNVLGVRASIGSRMKELDYLDSAGQDLNIQYESTLSDLQDLDTVKAISQFAQQQFTLEAAQKSFKSMSGLSLFNFIG
ncbi:MAG: flagellar hook-associated protein FlgL [Gammaproteobacteria bacterium]